MSGNQPVRYYVMLKHWAAMAAGRSYWHREQGIGRAFRPGELYGYFNDVTAKADWPGEVDGNGLPLCNAGGRKVHWPTTVLQKGLAHWDLWLESGCTAEDHWNNFRNVAQWALETQDARGGWAHPARLHPHALSDYSCMSQGQGISILARAWRETGQAKYLEAATRAAHAMLVPVSSGGTSVYLGEHIVLEEFPSPELRPVLNGWIFCHLWSLRLSIGRLQRRTVSRSACNASWTAGIPSKVRLWLLVPVRLRRHNRQSVLPATAHRPDGCSFAGYPRKPRSVRILAGSLQPTVGVASENKLCGRIQSSTEVVSLPSVAGERWRSRRLTLCSVANCF